MHAGGRSFTRNPGKQEKKNYSTATGVTGCYKLEAHGRQSSMWSQTFISYSSSLYIGSLYRKQDDP
jgi:hypothetical protein